MFNIITNNQIVHVTPCRRVAVLVGNSLMTQGRSSQECFAGLQLVSRTMETLARRVPTAIHGILIDPFAHSSLSCQEWQFSINRITNPTFLRFSDCHHTYIQPGYKICSGYRIQTYTYNNKFLFVTFHRGEIIEPSVSRIEGGAYFRGQRGCLQTVPHY